MPTRSDLENDVASLIFAELTRGRGAAHERARQATRRVLDAVERAGWMPPPSATGCVYCGAESHGMACPGLMRGEYQSRA